jgi:hypothetical protein
MNWCCTPQEAKDYLQVTTMNASDWRLAGIPALLFVIFMGKCLVLFPCRPAEGKQFELVSEGEGEAF